ncbi:ABC transporter ATP-binding protein [Mycoplasmopsis alligatoris]|uniref:ABC transporter, ATP-binding protein n=1 Tax=Mycoplasmopsis alligatoris A21JP2 TaxID=747682 RepID=D4XUW6_9BACT|nr:ABC transporter ATP-binding protein [Mycoplasmopsis alligatoris]EFF41852.1 ABC transporter, ATP-binding protein [Mycoplasmopsis alligatoris A21JP2]
MQTKIENAVEFVNMTKDFPGIRANDDVSFKVKKGSIHAIIGENGAGKSTLMSILFGLYEPTKGYIKINDEAVFIKNPNDANRLGIGMVHQHFKLVDIYTNLENIIIGSEYNKSMVMDQKLSRKKIEAIQHTYNLNFDLNQITSESTVSTQQKVEILKMLYRDSDILVFDEPTAVLTDAEIQGLLQTFKRFKELGKTILFISHKLNEIKEVADTATVIRHGKVIGNYDVKKTSIPELAKAMVGKTVVLPKNTSKANFGHTVMKFQNVYAKATKQVTDLNFEIKSGQILAVAGVEGNGQELIEFLCSGLLKPNKGKILFYKQKQLAKNDKDLKKGFFTQEDINQNPLQEIDLTHASVQKKSEQGISYIPGDRHKYGLVLDYTISENAILRRLKDPLFNKYSIINLKNRNDFSNEIIEKFDVRGSREGRSKARSLSGGNQQKAIVGREMLTPHDLIIVVQPTRGLDVGAINQIHQDIIKEKENGKAILLISYELDEVLALADTIMVLSGGKIQGMANKENVTREQIGLWMADIKQGDKHE